MTATLPGRRKTERLIARDAHDVPVTIPVTLHSDSWAGRVTTRAVLLARHGHVFRVRLLEPIGTLEAGSVTDVPAACVEFPAR